MNDEIKSSRIQALEQSLINFLTNKKDLEEKIGTGYRRIRTLQIKLDGKNIKHPTFSVQIGMFEAVFNMNNGLKEKGSCLGLEQYIRDWVERDSIKNEMMSIVNINARGGSGGTNSPNVRNLLR